MTFKAAIRCHAGCELVIARRLFVFLVATRTFQNRHLRHLTGEQNLEDLCCYNVLFASFNNMNDFFPLFAGCGPSLVDLSEDAMRLY
jgi:hypothetical protein